MEGGDTWYFDSQTMVHPMFHIVPIEDGSSDLSTLSGASGTFSNGMSFLYNGENQYIDKLATGNQSFILFNNQSPDYTAAIAYDAGTYKTIGTSFEFAGLTDGTFPSTKNNLMQEYLNFFGIHPPPLQANFVGFPTNVTPGGAVSYSNFSTGGVTSWNWSFPGGTPATSTEENPVVTYNNPGIYDVSLVVNNGSGNTSLVRTGYIHVDYATHTGNLTGLNCSVFPNPGNGLITLNLNSLKNDIVDIQVYNALGNVVYNEGNIEVTYQMKKVLDLRSLPAGLYYMKVAGKETSLTRKIVIQK